jgi:hypothetical protein
MSPKSPGGAPGKKPGNALMEKSGDAPGKKPGDALMEKSGDVSWASL